MDHVTKLLKDCEQGRIDRRQFLEALGITATAAFVVGAFPQAAAAMARGVQAASGKPFAATTVNHLSVSTPDYVRSRDFYIDVLGMRDAWDDGLKCQLDFGPVAAPNSLYIVGQAKPGTPLMSHYAFGLPNFWAQRDGLKAELDRGGYQGVRADGEAGFMVNGPSGYQVQPVPVKDPAMFPGAASPCEVAKSEKCQAAYEVGIKKVAGMPKPTRAGTGLTATHFKHIVLHVADIGKERDFYSGLLGLKVVSDKPGECSMRFGDNTLVLRPAGSDGKAYINETGYAIQAYDSAKAKAELDRRSLNPKPGSTPGAWAFSDPDGFQLEVGA